MPLKLLASICLVALAGCATPPAKDPPVLPAPKAESAATDDGHSFETAIVINASNESTGVAAEYAWIRAHLPGSRPAGQAVLNHAGKMYDLIHVKLPNGSMRDVYFDITGFFGKM